MGLERIKTRGDRANHFENTGTLKKAREIFMGINKPYLYKIDALQNAENITKLIVNELTVRMVDVVADSGVSPKDKLEKTLNLFGGKLES
jgi:thymidylate kinase